MALEEKRELQYTIQELALNIERQDAQIRHLTRTVAEIGKPYSSNIGDKIQDNR